MESYEAIKRAVHESGSSAKELAPKLELTPSMVHRWMEPPPPRGSGERNPLDRVGKLIEALHRPDQLSPLVHWVCEKAGGHFVPDPPPAPQTHPRLADASAQAVILLAKLIQEITECARDGEITREESRKLEKQWRETQFALQMFVLGCQHRLFTRTGDDESDP
jgi:hypothetical protein